jgi:hypothetical protein
MKYINITYNVCRTLFKEKGQKEVLSIDFKEGNHYVDFRRMAIKYLFELHTQTKKEYYGCKWEILFTIILWYEDNDLDNGTRVFFHRGNQFDLIKIKSNKLNLDVNWKNLKIEREAAIDSMPDFWEFDFVETKFIGKDDLGSFQVLDEGLFNLYEIEL